MRPGSGSQMTIQQVQNALCAAAAESPVSQKECTDRVGTEVGAAFGEVGRRKAPILEGYLRLLAGLPQRACAQETGAAQVPCLEDYVQGVRRISFAGRRWELFGKQGFLEYAVHATKKGIAAPRAIEGRITIPASVGAAMRKVAKGDSDLLASMARLYREAIKGLPIERGRDPKVQARVGIGILMHVKDVARKKHGRTLVQDLNRSVVAECSVPSHSVFLMVDKVPEQMLAAISSGTHFDRGDAAAMRQVRRLYFTLQRGVQVQGAHLQGRVRAVIGERANRMLISGIRTAIEGVASEDVAEALETGVIRVRTRDGATDEPLEFGLWHIARPSAPTATEVQLKGAGVMQAYRRASIAFAERLEEQREDEELPDEPRSTRREDRSRQRQPSIPERHDAAVRDMHPPPPKGVVGATGGILGEF